MDCQIFSEKVIYLFIFCQNFGFWNRIDRDTNKLFEKKMFEIVWVYHLSDSAAGCEPPRGEDKLSEAFGRILINWTIYFLPLDNGGLYQIM